MLEVKVAEVLTCRREAGVVTSTGTRRSPFMAAGEDTATGDSPPPLTAGLDAPRGRPLDMAGGDPGPPAAPPALGPARHPLPVTLPPPAPPTPPTTPP